jgi:hypothetical protein
MLVSNPTCLQSSNTQVFAALWLSLLAFLPQPSSVGLSSYPVSVCSLNLGIVPDKTQMEA